MTPDRKTERLSRASKDRLVAASEGREGIYLVEGLKAVADALTSPATLSAVFLADDVPASDLDAIADAAKRRDVPVQVAPRKDLDRASETVTPQGALAIVADTCVPAADVLARASGPVLLLDRIQDPGNVGAVFRVAAALGASGVLVADGSADPLRAKALRASAGTALRVPFSRGPLVGLLDACHAADVPLWLLDAAGSEVWALTERPRGVVLAIGSEGEGPAAALVGHAEARVSIPMAPGVESLNAAVAAGIALAVIARLPVAGAAPAAGPAVPPPAAPRSGGIGTSTAVIAAAARLPRRR